MHDTSVLEVADARGEEHHLGDRNTGGCARAHLRHGERDGRAQREQCNTDWLGHGMPLSLVYIRRLSDRAARHMYVLKRSAMALVVRIRIHLYRVPDTEYWPSVLGSTPPLWFLHTSLAVLSSGQ